MQQATLPAYLPISTPTLTAPLLLPVTAGCGFRIEPICLTIRNDSLVSQNSAQPLLVTMPPASTTVPISGQCDCIASFTGLVEAILQFEIRFDKPFKHSPAITTSLELAKPFSTIGTSCTTYTCPNFCCPLVCGGALICTEVAPCIGPVPIGYINDIALFLSDVTDTSCRVWLDVKVVVPTPTVGLAAFVAFIEQALITIHFHAISTNTVDECKD